MNIALGARCPWCRTIVAEPARLATAAGVGTGSVCALEVRPTTPAAHIAVGKQDVTREDGTDRGHTIAALEGFPGSLFESGVPTAPLAAPSVNPHPAGLPAPETIPPVVVSGAPIARNTDPQAAHDAAARARHDYTFDQWLVLAAHVASRDLNGDELGAVCGRPYQSVGPRRPALERNGLIEETGTRRKGKGCYRATDAGRAAWRDCPASIRPTVLAQLTNTAVMALRGAA